MNRLKNINQRIINDCRNIDISFISRDYMLQDTERYILRYKKIFDISRIQMNQLRGALIENSR